MFSVQPIINLLSAYTRQAERLQINGDNPVTDLSGLPEILQRYLGREAVAGRKRPGAVRIVWKDAALKFNPKGNWTPMECSQINFVGEPVRLVYMRLRFFGFLRLEALDSYLNGKGRMLIRLLKYFKLSDAKGPQMDRSELVTILAETMLIPSYALQKYIGWTIIDPLTIKGTINYKGTRASGLFYFNNDGDILRFETLDRYYTDGKGRFQQVKWIAAITRYQLNGNHKSPSDFSATWKRPEGDYTYFKGEIVSVQFNR